MPKVGDKEFSYTPEGMEAAKQEATLTGEPLEQTPEYDTYDATQRNQVVEGYQEGGGTPEPTQYAKGGEVPQYAWGGKILGGMKKRVKQAMTRPSQWREWKPFEQRGLGLGKVLAGGAQALTNTDDPMYGKLSDSNIQSLGDMFGALNKSRHDIVDPTDPNTTGFGYKKGGEVNPEEGRLKETTKKHGRTKVVKKDISINVGNEKVSLGKISSLETDFVDTPVDDLIKGAGKAIKEGVKAFKPGVKKAKEKATERAKAYRKGLKETGETAKKVIGKAKESISKVTGAIKTQAEKQKAERAKQEAQSEAELKADLKARHEKEQARKEKRKARREKRKAKVKETIGKIKGSLKRKDKKLKYRDDDTGGKYK